MVGEGAGGARRAGAIDLPPQARATTLTDHGIVGTPLYMSPEAIRGEEPDASFDLWALTVVLYEALAGESPVERSSWTATLRAIETADVPDIRGHVPEASATLAEFFSGALHPDVSRRPASAEEFCTRWQQASLE
jgi:serine/threonine protein kinase